MTASSSRAPSGIFQRFRVGILVLLSVFLIFHLPSAKISILNSSISGKHDRKCGGHVGFEPGKLGAVASENAICTRHGTDMLRMGGNAADAVSAYCPAHPNGCSCYGTVLVI